MRRTLAALAFVLIAPSVHAQDQALPGTYRIDPARTHVAFVVNRFGSDWRGEFADASGSLTLPPGDVRASHLEVSIPVSSLATASRRMDAILKGPGWFDVARYPTMTFRSTLVTPTAAASADVVGELTLHGVTRSVTFKVKFDAAALGAAGFEARGRIRRTEFGIGRWAFLVGDGVDLIINAAFTRAGD